MWQHKLQHRFVDRIPREIDAGVLYVSIEYATAAHSCACGCGEEVMTPLTPTDWKMTFDGEAVSLWPSIGNWQLPCRSHYIIENGMIRRAGNWTQQQVEASQSHDNVAKKNYYRSLQEAPRATTSEAGPSSAKLPDAGLNLLPNRSPANWLYRFRSWIRRISAQAR